MEGWDFPIRQPVVKPAYERRNKVEALWDLADRIGMREEMNNYYNVYFSSFGGEALISGDIASVRDVKRIDPSKVTVLIKPEEKITYHEMMDRAFKFYFGEKHGLEYISEHGTIALAQEGQGSLLAMVRRCAHSHLHGAHRRA